MRAGWTWFTQAWKLFTRRWGTWLLIFFILQVINLIINFGLQYILIGMPHLMVFPVMIFLLMISLTFTGGIMLSCDALVEGDELEVGYLFSAFKYKLGTFLKLSFFIITMLILMLLLLALLENIMGVNPRAQDDLLLSLFWILITLFFVLPIFMMMWHSPALITLHDMTASKAMKKSLSGCLKNFGAFMVNGLVWLGLYAILAQVVLMIIPGDNLHDKMLFISFVMMSLMLKNIDEKSIMILGQVITIIFVVQFCYTMLLNFVYYTSYRNIWTISKAKEKQ